MIGRTRSNRRNRRHIQPSQAPYAANVTPANTIVATKWRMIFPVPMAVVASVSAFAGWTNEGVAPTSVTQVNSVTVDLGYAAAVVATDIAIIPANSPAMRTYSGGFANAVAHTFP
jgi:hypothetical protein